MTHRSIADFTFTDGFFLTLAAVDGSAGIVVGPLAELAPLSVGNPLSPFSFTSPPGRGDACFARVPAFAFAVVRSASAFSSSLRCSCCACRSSATLSRSCAACCSDNSSWPLRKTLLCQIPDRRIDPSGRYSIPCPDLIWSLHSPTYFSPLGNVREPCP